jgi:hypothetical protein
MIFSNENWNSNKSYHLGSSADIYKCYLYWSSTWFTCIVKMTQLHRKIIALLFLVWYKTIPIFALLLQLCICGVDVSFKPAKYAKWIWNWWKIKLKKYETSLTDFFFRSIALEKWVWQFFLLVEEKWWWHLKNKNANHTQIFTI